MSASRHDWARLLFDRGGGGAGIVSATWSGSGVSFGGGEPAQAALLAHVGDLEEGDRVLCAVTGSGALYVLGKVVS